MPTNLPLWMGDCSLDALSTLSVHVAELAELRSHSDPSLILELFEK